MDIQSYKISTTKDKSASRSGLAALAELIRKLGLDAHFERPVPEPGSSRGLRPGAYLTTFMLMMHEGSRHLSGVAHAACPAAGGPPAAGGRAAPSQKGGPGHRRDRGAARSLRRSPHARRSGAACRSSAASPRPAWRRVRSSGAARSRRTRATASSSASASGRRPKAPRRVAPASTRRATRRGSSAASRAGESATRSAPGSTKAWPGRPGRWTSRGGSPSSSATGRRARRSRRRGASPVQRLPCQRAAFRAVHARLQPVRADAPGAGRELRVDAHRDLSPPALLQGGQDRAPCPRPGLEAVRRAGGAAA